VKADDRERPRRRKWWIAALAAALGLSLIALAALPWWLGTDRARGWLLAKANRVLAPGSIDLATFRCSWVGPLRVTGFVLRDADGEPVAAAKTATLDRNLFQLLFLRPQFGTLRLDGALIDAERSPSGAIDLYEALRPLLGRDPDTSIRIVTSDALVRFRAEGLMEPVVAGHSSLEIAVEPVPGPISWKAKLGSKGARSLEAVGRFYRGAVPGGGADLELALEGKGWPWTLGDRNAQA
jgi:translocation and assembly module TamB